MGERALTHELLRETLDELRRLPQRTITPEEECLRERMGLVQALDGGFPKRHVMKAFRAHQKICDACKARGEQ